MALNQLIESPLTLFSGSIISHTLPSGSDKGPMMVITGSALPTFVASPWVQKIKSSSQTLATTTQTNLTELTAVLANNTRYLVYAYILGGSTGTANGFRASITSANTTVLIWNTETPLTTTTTSVNNNAAGAAATSPANSITNYYCTILRGIVATAAAGTPTINITAASEIITGGNQVQVAAGSMLFYRAY